MQIQESMGALVDAGVVKLAQDDNWLTVELSSGLLFNSGSAFSGEQCRPCARYASGILKPVDNYVRVRGYTDNQPINNEIFPLQLDIVSGPRRGSAQCPGGQGWLPGRLAYEAYGEFSPSSNNGTEQGRLQNRKVVVAISRFAWVPPAPSNH